MPISRAYSKDNFGLHNVYAERGSASLQLGSGGGAPSGVQGAEPLVGSKGAKLP